MYASLSVEKKVSLQLFVEIFSFIGYLQQARVRDRYSTIDVDYDYSLCLRTTI